jgi:hypothetical protein
MEPRLPCDCPYVRRRRAHNGRILRALLLALSVLLAGTAIVVALHGFGLIDRDEVDLSGFYLLLAVGFTYLESVRAYRPVLVWRTLSAGDFAQVLIFPVLTAYGWHDTIVGALSGWDLTVAVFVLTLTTCVLALEFVLRTPAAVRRNRVLLFGRRCGVGLTVEFDARRHRYFHRAGRSERRRAALRARARRTARMRRAWRAPGSRRAALARGFDRHVLRPYESTAMWLSTYTISAAIFPLAVAHTTPSEPMGLLILSPMAAIPVLTFGWAKLKNWYPGGNPPRRTDQPVGPAAAERSEGGQAGSEGV